MKDELWAFCFCIRGAGLLDPEPASHLVKVTTANISYQQRLRSSERETKDKQVVYLVTLFFLLCYQKQMMIACLLREKAFGDLDKCRLSVSSDELLCIL
jgi:hypothetical protein